MFRLQVAEQVENTIFDAIVSTAAAAKHSTGPDLGVAETTGVLECEPSAVRWAAHEWKDPKWEMLHWCPFAT